MVFVMVKNCSNLGSASIRSIINYSHRFCYEKEFPEKSKMRIEKAWLSRQDVRCMLNVP